MAVGWRVGTANLRHFQRIAGLDILPVTFGRPGNPATGAAGE